MKRIITLIFVLGTVASCASIPGQSQNQVQDQLKAENRLMKKNSELALRENEVLKTENAQYKLELDQLNETVQQLSEDLATLKVKYDEDMARANDAYENLCDHFTALEQESDGKIQELTESNTALEKRFSDEVSRLNGILEDQKTAVQSERDLMKSGFESKLKELEEQVSLSKRESAEKDKAIESLEKNNKEAKSRISALEKTVKDQDENLKQSETNYKDMVVSNQRLQKDIDAKQAVIDELNAKIKAMQDSTEQKTNQ
jgi:chromosome segregation ATPase